ncbi:discoidin domain-containing protein [Umezawaea endophytica]|uniref:Discoidin domain-containing protein n=1 Tax=Umezawaea endophytica TaxID=1654476 RepID=A0A9X2VK05_9PSEU|nr:discoidin domain-containing protein [Umezawaea endophytica]MCS7478068.1 discoidin domain-containing protein [Umezawaea endophytica]
MADFLLNRRRLLGLIGASTVAVTWDGSAWDGSASAKAADPVADTYYRVLLRHTRWSETQFDATAGRYRRTDFGFAVVLGNALLLTRGAYDAQVTGISKDDLRTRTVATIKHFAASNALVGGTEWGKTLFWDTTFQSYFVLAARLLWAGLDAATREAVDTIARAQAEYTVSLGTGNDPRSGAWTPNGLTGGYQGDTKLEEMGVYAQSLAPGLAWAATVPEEWRTAFGRWSRNMAGLPAADLANPVLVDGVAVSANTAANVHDTYVVENHGSFGPHYQEELWRTSARNAVHFLLAGRPLPEVITAQPNGDRLWRTILGTMSDAGEPLMPMVADREHLYGRDVIPLAFRAQVLGDRYAARAEADLAARLEAYQAYPPADRMAKFSGEPKYEPEARAEITIAYLLHELRPRPVPVESAELFRFASGATDFGAGPGLLAQQSERAWAGTVSKAGLVKFAWQPSHDDWLFVISGGTPMLLPSTGLAVRGRFAKAYNGVRDGFDATASVLAFDSGRAGMVTLPTGTVVYATSGVAAGEGRVSVHNLTMPGVPGLDGDRVFTAAEGSTTVRAPEGVGRADDHVFGRTTARYVRMVGITPHPTYGYSLYAFEVRDGGGADLARGRTASASSFDTGREPGFAVDGDAGTRWAVSKADRPRADSWLAVDLGAAVPLDRVRLHWEAAAGQAYRVEASPDGTRWDVVATYPRDDLRSTGRWLDVDGRAGFVVHGSAAPIAVRGTTVVLSDGPAAGFVAEGYVGAERDLRAIAAAGAPVCPDGVRASVADGYLSLFNLDARRVTGVVSVRQSRTAVRVYQGVQRITAVGTDHDVVLEAASARVEAPRFTVRRVGGGAVPVGVTVTVLDGQRVRVTGPAAMLLVEQAGGIELPVVPGVEVVFPGGRPYPLADLAVGRVTFPSAPLPTGMSDPGAVVDDDPRTSWTPGANGRVVVDLGAVVAIGEVVLTWTAGAVPSAAVATSVDGRAYAPAGVVGRGRRASVVVGTSARYLAVGTGWRGGQARLVSVVVRAAT